VGQLENKVALIGSEEEVARTVAWMFSEGTSFMTGHTLVIDGAASA